ncbi:hypothetical protein ANCCEY_11879 [Ancylostoma ceylanicum]|uniref:Uncharacterized protein n=1 Tax=Ancylostoma ceylanicum TaxID=53326 RepID=A0A0D6LGH8_9BILA|nr:hypothetical protein ANCCEY_11879 [Ancylostoma ceylanicum]
MTEPDLSFIKSDIDLSELAGIPDPGPKQQDSVKSSSVDNAKVSAASEFNVNAPAAQLRTDMPSSSQQGAAPPPETAATTVQPAAATNEEVAAVEQQNVLLVKDDPAFAKYFRMIKLGIVEPAVKQKMQQEGFDPALLDTPNAPSPNSAKASDPTNAALSQADDSDSSSVSSFSDSD